jgi:hypothetical protein
MIADEVLDRLKISTVEDLKKDGNGTRILTDSVIDISIMKIRGMQENGAKDERKRLLVANTLQRAIKMRLSDDLIKQKEVCNNLSGSTNYMVKSRAPDQVGLLGSDHPNSLPRQFATVLRDAIVRLGLSRVVRIGVEYKKNDPNGFWPRVRLPAAGKRIRSLGSIYHIQ